MRHWPRDQSCLMQKSLRANTRGEDVSGLARNDRMCSSQERRELPRRLSRITMEITTSLGSHTVVARFLRRLFRFHLAPPIPHHTDDVCAVVFSSLSPPFRVRPKVKSCTCTSGYVRKRAIYLGSRMVLFSRAAGPLCFSFLS